MRIYGVLNENKRHVDVSKSLAITKTYAKVNGFTKITCRFDHNSIILFEKIGNKWTELRSKSS